jgi:multisubunit Na+/H+ antiporter MnhB subunit
MTTILTQTIARLLFLPTLMVALATLVKGYAETGDGFTAGVIAGLAVLLQYVAFGEREMANRLPVRFAPAVAYSGLLLGLVVTFLPVIRGKPILTHEPAANASVTHIGSVEILTAVAFDVAVFLLVFGFVVSTIGLVSRARQGRIP